MSDRTVVRELFIDELEKVNGGGPIQELIDKVAPGPIDVSNLEDQLYNTTHACCEEGPDGCC